MKEFHKDLEQNEQELEQNNISNQIFISQPVFTHM